MGGLTPFGEEERASLSRAARTLIWGENVTGAVRADVAQWGRIIRMYLLYASPDNGSMRAPPFSGGILEQPYRTTQVFQAIQEKFLEKIAEDNEEMKRRMPIHG